MLFKYNMSLVQVQPRQRGYTRRRKSMSISFLSTSSRSHSHLPPRTHFALCYRETHLPIFLLSPHALRFFIYARLPLPDCGVRRGERDLLIRRRKRLWGGTPGRRSGWRRGSCSPKEETPGPHHHQSQEGLQGSFLFTLAFFRSRFQPRVPLISTTSSCSLELHIHDFSTAMMLPGV